MFDFNALCERATVSPFRGSILRPTPDQRPRVVGMNVFGHTVYSNVVAVGSGPDSKIVHIHADQETVAGYMLVKFRVTLEHEVIGTYVTDREAIGVASQFCAVREEGYDHR